MSGERFEGWFVLELMGHRRLAGYVTEQTIAGAGFLRIDVPGKEGEPPRATQFYPPSAVYAMTPTSEQSARRIAEASVVQPVSIWDLPDRRPALESGSQGDEEEF